MANYRKDKVYAVVITANRGPALRKIESKTIDSFIHDVVEGYFEVIHTQDIASQHGLIMLVNETGLLDNLPVNLWASRIYRDTHRQALVPSALIYGDVVILRHVGTSLEPFNKNDALDIVTSILRGGR